MENEIKIPLLFFSGIDFKKFELYFIRLVRKNLVFNDGVQSKKVTQNPK